MIIIGVDFHPEFQQIALLNTTTGEAEEKRLAHPRVCFEPLRRRTVLDFTFDGLRQFRNRRVETMYVSNTAAMIETATEGPKLPRRATRTITIT